MHIAEQTQAVKSTVQAAVVRNICVFRRLTLKLVFSGRLSTKQIYKK